MAQHGAEEAEHEPALLAGHDGLGRALGDQQRRVLGRGDDERCPGRCRSGRAASRASVCGREDRPVRPGIQLRLAHRPADPEPRDRRVAPGLLGREQGAGGSRASATSAATSGSSRPAQRVARRGPCGRRRRDPAGARTAAPSRRSSRRHRARAGPPRTRAACSRHPGRLRRRSRGPRPSGMRTVSSAAIAASRSPPASADRVRSPARRPSPMRALRPAGGSPMKLVWPANRCGAPIRAPAGNTRIEPSASRTRNPIARSSAKSSPLVVAARLDLRPVPDAGARSGAARRG